MIVVTAVIPPSNPRYFAYCNFPCPSCVKPESFGIQSCSGTRTGGNTVPQGVFPYVDGANVINGGVPQAANLTLHLETIRDTVDTILPNTNYSGNGVLDFENWTPNWDENNSPDDSWHGIVYQLMSLNIVRIAHPTWNDTQIAAAARHDFQTAAINFFVQTLKLLKELRPKAKWGFYGLPLNIYASGCVRVNGELKCGYSSPTIGPTYRGYNDEIKAVWQESTALYPSVYLPPQHSMNYSYWQEVLSEYVADTITETIRLATLYNSTASLPVLGFYWAYYHNGTTYLTAADVALVISQSYLPPMSTGLILWGYTDDALPSYFRNVEGPLFESQVWSASNCSTASCSAHGWCRTPFVSQDTSCICDQGYTGVSCEKVQ